MSTGMMAQLHVFKKGQLFTRKPVPEDGLNIGRSLDRNDLVLTGPLISRQHAVIKKEKGRYVLRNLSKNGTFVDGNRQEESVLEEGSVIRIGVYELKFFPYGGEKRGTAGFSTIAAAEKIDEDALKAGIGNILVIEGNSSDRKKITKCLSEKYKVNSLEHFGKLSKILDLYIYDVILIGVGALESRTVDQIRKLQVRFRDQCIISAAPWQEEWVRKLLDEGIYEVLRKPVNKLDLVRSIDRAVESVKTADKLRTLMKDSASVGQSEYVIGNSEHARKLKQKIERLKAYPTEPALILGESGVGKGMLAKYIHSRTFADEDSPFISVNVNAIPESLVESELFGHEKGSFTGADKKKIGKCELASGGTIFLDEIGDLSMPVQVKLLHFFDNDHSFSRIGSSAALQFTGRVITATNQNLHQKIATNEFREDLFFRITTFTLRLPPLRERKEDIHVFIKHFLHKCAGLPEQFSQSLCTQKAYDKIFKYPWPGNIRELENWIRRLVIEKQITPDGHGLPIDDHDVMTSFPEFGSSEKDYWSELKFTEIKEQIFCQRLKRHNGNIHKTAESLGVSHQTLRNFLKSR